MQLWMISLRESETTWAHQHLRDNLNRMLSYIPDGLERADIVKPYTDLERAAMCKIMKMIPALAQRLQCSLVRILTRAQLQVFNQTFEQIVSYGNALVICDTYGTLPLSWDDIHPFDYWYLWLLTLVAVVEVHEKTGLNVSEELQTSVGTGCLVRLCTIQKQLMTHPSVVAKQQDDVRTAAGKLDQLFCAELLELMAETMG